MATDADTATTAEPEARSSRRERVGWYLYDWANSAFYTTVVVAFIGAVPDRAGQVGQRLCR